MWDDLRADPSHRLAPAELIAYIEPIAPAPAGQRFAYSNTNYVLLGQLVERLDGADLGTALQARISEPLGLHATRFDTAAAAPPEGLAVGWAHEMLDGGVDDVYDAIASAAWAAGALVSTAGDLAAFLAALFGGRLISDAVLAEMTVPGPEGYGLGLATGVDFSFGPGRVGYGHGGAIPGYRASMSIAPDSGDTLVVLVNNEDIRIDILTNRILEAGW